MTELLLKCLIVGLHSPILIPRFKAFELFIQIDS